MKALIVSDIHANIVALEHIWKQEKDSDVIYCAGDLVDYGPYPKEVIDWVRGHHVICVKGNHDERVSELYRDSDRLRNVQDDERTWAHVNAQKLDEKDIEFLDNLPYSVTFSMGSIDYCMQHMYKDYDTIQSLVHFNEFWERQTSKDFKDSIYRRMIFGHTHRRTVHYVSDQDLWLNPGSSSYRRQDDPTKVAHYMTITDQHISMKELNYDRSSLLQATLSMPVSPKERRVTNVFFGE